MDSVTTESTEFWTLWEKARVGCFERTTSKHVYYLGWNISPAQAGCVRQVLRPGALGRLRGIGWRRRWEGGIGMGNTCKSMADSCQCMTKPLQYCKVISLQITKINGKKNQSWSFPFCISRFRFIVSWPGCHNLYDKYFKIILM